MSAQPDVQAVLEKLIKRIQVLNEILQNSVPKEIEKYKKEYNEALDLLGELNGFLSK